MSDLNDRFGVFTTVGLGFGVKTETNKYIGFRLTLLTGAEVQEPDLLSNLLTSSGEIIDNQGDVAFITISGRGAILGIHGGVIIPSVLPFKSSNPNSGLFLRGGIGSIHHRIGFAFTENHITQLEDPYLAGYDRLSWGAYASGFIGYWYMDENRRFNAFVGVYGFASRSYPMRTSNFDTGIPDIEPRFDVGLGIELGWVVHMYKRAPKEYWY